MNRRLIILTNDDGIDAPGLLRLARAAVNFGEVWIVAPDGQRSAASHSISLRVPFDVYPQGYPVEGVKAFYCTGSAADCVRVGFHNILPGVPDVVLSGVNHGYNVGADLQYSATAGAAFEAVFLGSRAIAFSEDHTSHGETAEYYLNSVLEELIDQKSPDRSILNVNFTGSVLSECKGILRDRFVSRHSGFRDKYRILETLPGGGARYLIEGAVNIDSEPGSDLRAVLDGYVSIGTVKNVS